jgi:hypothetical protein
MSLRVIFLIWLGAMMISGCAGRPRAVSVMPAKVQQLPFPEPPARLMTPLARPAGGWISTLPQPQPRLQTKP